MTAINTSNDMMQVPRTGRYTIDTGGSTMTFKSRHLFGLAPVTGRFSIRQGTTEVADPIADSRVHVEIDAASFHTGGRQRDADVRSARFLDVERHPTMTFTSQRLERSGDGWHSPAR
jgi:polyisoprenoid-binding protein YceI